MSAKRFEIYAPVIIPTLCRFEHFKRCIDSLSKCTGAEYTDVYIGIDYPTKEEHWVGYKKICDYVRKVSGFNELIVLIRDHNLGPSGNIKDLKKHIKNKTDRYILSEDDNEFSPNFLEYMNEGLTLYKDNPNVLKICGCLMPWHVDFEKCIKTYPYNVFPAKDYNAFGAGSWFSKQIKIPYTKDSVIKSVSLTAKTLRYGYWQAITRFIHQIKKDSQLPDVCFRLYCAFNDKYCIFPRVSKVKNWGFDGTGLHSDNNPRWLDVVRLDTATTFEFDEVDIKDYKEVKDFVYQMYGVNGFRRKFGIILRYFLYRLTGFREQDVPKGQRVRSYFFKYIFSKK